MTFSFAQIKYQDTSFLCLSLDIVYTVIFNIIYDILGRYLGLSAGAVEYADYTSAERWALPLPTIVLSMILKCIWWSWSSTSAVGNLEHSFYCHYSRVHSDPEKEYLLCSDKWFKYNSSWNHLTVDKQMISTK